MTIPPIGDYVFVHDTGNHRPEFVTGIVHQHNEGNVVTLLVIEASGQRSEDYTPYSLYSWLPGPNTTWQALPEEHHSKPQLLHHIGLVSRALTILGRATQLQNNSDDNVGVFVNITDWRDAIALLKEVP